ncbi:ubiquinol oxidase 1 [Artemisia annua]|uniref:Ubiquinol oxidase n=1 Tax=Artemisia annua TaxID=35608 RepID=A0A2U1LUW0_ARTAN|nr:ubiquinol oxidase 1 [Artemisia annua]
MMRRGSTTVIRSILTTTTTSPRGFSTGADKAVVTWWMRSSGGARNASTVALGADKEEQRKEETVVNGGGGERKGNKEITSYWGVPPSRLTKEDGTEWKWNCFRPWETYQADLSIDLKKHHKPTTWLDKFAYYAVKSLRLPTDIFFQRRYGCRAMMLETVAAVPGMVGGMLLHCKSLRRFEHSGGWIKALLEEAENERMHLMTFMEVAKPKWYERALVFTVQGVFFNAYFLAYLASPKLAHRITGYLEEEAVHSYTEFLKELDKGNIENVKAPAIAIDYWRLPADATLRDVVMVVRADEAHHRDVNHFASDIHYQGRELKDNPAPIGYH